MIVKSQYQQGDKITAALQAKTDPFERGLTFSVVPADNTWPEYLLANRKRFEHFFAPDD